LGELDTVEEGVRGLDHGEVCPHQLILDGLGRQVTIAPGAVKLEHFIYGCDPVSGGVVND